MRSSTPSLSVFILETLYSFISFAAFSCDATIDQTFSGIESRTTSRLPCCISRPFFISHISFAIYSTSETICVDSMTIRSLESSLIMLRKRTLSVGSSPAVGSSNINIFGLFNIACAIPTLRFIPPDSFFIFLFCNIIY